jgi:predicted nuclease of predicted toxin-antitoxin system
MKMLLDANLSFRLVKKLADVYPQCLHVSRTGLTSPASDQEIWHWAKANDYIIIVSNDEDYRFLLERFGSPPKVVLLRTGNQSTEQIASILLEKSKVIFELAKSDEIDLLEIF